MSAASLALGTKVAAAALLGDSGPAVDLAAVAAATEEVSVGECVVVSVSSVPEASEVS